MGEALGFVVVGPTFPATGGIVHFTAGLVEALSARGPTLAVGWARRYPRRLYPGSLDDHASSTPISAGGAEPLLDLLDPRTWRAAARRMLAFEADALVVQWVHPLHAPVIRSLARSAARNGIPTLVICHNIHPHEPSRLMERLTRAGLGAADVLVVHAQALVADARAVAPRASIVEGFHPVYGNVVDALPAADASAVAAVRERLGAGDRAIVLSFGYVRPYKGIEDAIVAFARVRANAMLVVAGECWHDAERYVELVERLGLADRVRLVFRYFANDELPALFAAARAVVLPYRAASQSGVAALAFGFERPVVATRVGGLGELVEDGVTGALVPPRDSARLAQAIDDILADGRDWGPALRRARERLSWPRYAALIEAAARAAREEAPRRSRLLR